MFKDLILLLFPKHCNACYSYLLRYEKEICTNCRNELPVINTTKLPFDLSIIFLRNNNFITVDIVIPIPIHKKRLRSRGYNQVALYAKTIATSLTAEYRDDILIKKSHKKSQVFLTRKERFENILNSLSLHNSEAIKGKHVLIVDDIITTGATMKACLSTLKNKTAEISVASIALVKTQYL